MKEKRTRENKPAPNDQDFSPTRRQFLKTLGGGIFVFFSYSMLPAQERRTPGGQTIPTDFNAFVRIAPDGRVSCLTGKIEMGQGIVTSLAQMLAEELDVPLTSVDMVMGDTDLCPWDMGTWGSLTTRFFGPPLREAAAEARAILIQLASERLHVDKARLIVRDGVVQVRNNSKKRVTYGQLAQGKMIERHVTPKPSPKQVSQYTVVGKSYTRRDGAVKVTGKAQYAGDVRLPGMLYASILRPPAHGAKLKSADTSAVEADKEVRLVRDGDLIAVLHQYPDGAEKALARIKAEWDVPQSDLDPKTIYPHLLRVAPEGEVVTEGGDPKEGERLAHTTYEGTFYDHYMAHATIETHTALAKPEGDRMIVWASTQSPFGAKGQIAQALSMPQQKVRVITPFVGGGFGGKSANMQAVEAARLAKLTGRPGTGGPDAQGRVFLRHLQAGRYRKSQVGSGQSRPDHVLDLRCLFFRFERRWAALCNTQPSGTLSRSLYGGTRRSSIQHGPVAGTRRKFQCICQGVPHRYDGREAQYRPR